MKNSDKQEKNLIFIARRYEIVVLVAITLILLILATYPLLGTGFVTRDDMSAALFPLKWSVFRAQAEIVGRIGFLISSPIALVPYFLNNFIYYKAVQLGAILISVFSVSVLLKTVTNKTIVGYLWFLLFISLWQNTWEHNPLSAYPFSFSAQAALMATSCYLFYKSTDNMKKWLSSISAMIYLLVLFCSELWVLYFVLLVGIAFIKCIDAERRILKMLKMVQWHIVAIFIYLCAYFVWRAFHPSCYDGNIPSISSTAAFLKTLFVYSWGLFPGIQCLIHHQPISWNVLAIVKAICLLVLFFIIRGKLITIDISRRSIIYGLAASLFLIFAPNILVASTAKYQQWVAIGSTSYVYSHFSYFGIILLFVLVIVCCAKKAFFYYAVMVAFVLMSYLSDINNILIGRDQTYSRIKWVLVDTFLSSDEFRNLPEGSRIIAPSLWNSRGIAVPDDSYWSEYVLKRTKKKIVVEKKGENEYIELQYTDENNADFQYLAVKENGALIALYLWGDQCNNKPCSLLIQSNESQFINYLDTNTFIAKNGINIIPLRATNVAHRIHKVTFDNSSLKLNGPIVVLPYSLSHAHGESITINFLDGFYALEHDRNGMWRWCSGLGTININSCCKQVVRLQINALPASNGPVWLTLPDGAKINLSAKETDDWILVSLNKGDNKLSMSVDYPPVRLNPNDPRIFSFMLKKLIIVPYVPCDTPSS